MKKALTGSILAIAALMLTACDYRVGELTPGKSTSHQVRDVLGTPTGEWKEADGTMQWEFARGPQGVVTYMTVIGTDGVLKEFRQVLQPTYFGKIQPGMTKDEVKKIIGRHGESMPFPLKKEEVQSWRYEEGPNDQYHFNVHYSMQDGKVASTSKQKIGENR
jgi:hypothetical protein